MKAQAPKITPGNGIHADYTETHPAFAMLSISRMTTGGGMVLFGSSIKHNEIVTLRISAGSVVRNLNTHWYHDEEQYIEVWMSATQFAEAITHMNRGGGTPVTLRWLDGKTMPEIIGGNIREKFHDEFKEKVADVGALLDKAISAARGALEKPNKTELKAVLSALETAKQQIVSNMPFVVDQFDEQVQQSVHEAKGEIDAFVTRIVHETGIKSLTNSKPALMQDNSKKEDE